MRDDPTSRLLAAVAAPVRRWPERRMVVLLSAIAMFACIFVVRQVVVGTGDAISMLYVIPVALLALEMGLLAGVLAALAATVGVATWMASANTGIGPVGLAVRASIFLVVGAVAGRFSDRMHRQGRREESLLRSGLDLARLDEREALAPLLATHARRAVRAASVRVELEGGASVNRGAPDGELLRVPIVSRGTTMGWIELTAGAERRFSPEDRLAVEAIALQAAVAGENRRLLALEREQAVLIGEMERMRKRLGDQLRNASRLIEHHEQERAGIAKRLHDEAAQAMAGALLTVSLLERGVNSDMSGPQMEQVRRQVKACIVDLRHIAGSLRPAALDEMGLVMALERFTEIEEGRQAQDGRQPRLVRLTVGELPEPLPPDVETSTYRAIEGMLEEMEGAGSVSVSVSTMDEDTILIVLQAEPIAAARAARATVEPAELCLSLTATRARVELIGGSLEVCSTPGGGKRVRIEIPIASELL